MKRFEATLKKRNEENIATKTGTVKLHANVEALLQKQEEDNVPRYMRLTRKQIMRASKVGRQIDSLEAKKREMAEVADKWSKGNETNNKFEETLKARRDDFDKKQKARREREERDEIYQKMKSEQEGLPRYMRRSHNSLTKAASSMRKKGDIIATQTLKMTAVDFDEDGEEIEREPYGTKLRSIRLAYIHGSCTLTTCCVVFTCIISGPIVGVFLSPPPSLCTHTCTRLILSPPSHHPYSFTHSHMCVYIHIICIHPYHVYLHPLRSKEEVWQILGPLL